MKFINDEVDVYVSTWDKTVIKNELLGIDIEEDITEDRIRKLLPNATILIEPTSCFNTVKYSDSMMYRWEAGWQMVLASNRQYDRILIIRPDMMFDAYESILYPESVQDVAVMWYAENLNEINDVAFLFSWDFATRFFEARPCTSWQNSNNSDVHAWMYSFVHSLAPNKIVPLFPTNSAMFFRPTVKNDIKSHNMEHNMLRYYDWRDSVAILRNKFYSPNEQNFDSIVTSWGQEVSENILLAWRGGIVTNTKQKNALVVLSGICRNFESFCLSIANTYESVEFGLSSWDDAKSRRLKEILRIKNNLFSIRNYDDVKNTLQQHLEKNQCVNLHYAMHHLKFAIEIAETSSYERIIITRPDCCMLVSDKLDTCDIDEHALNLSYGQYTGRPDAGDQYFIFNRRLIPLMKKLPDEVMRLISQESAPNIHSILPIALSNVGIPINAIQHSLIQNWCIQRESFRYNLNDVFSKNFYAEVQADSASWWRRMHNAEYRLNHIGLT